MASRTCVSRTADVITCSLLWLYFSFFLFFFAFYAGVGESAISIDAFGDVYGGARYFATLYFFFAMKRMNFIERT